MVKLVEILIICQLLLNLKKPELVEINFSKTYFLSFQAKKTFIHLQKAFIKTPIFRHFDFKCYIQIETNALGYAIGTVLN